MASGGRLGMARYGAHHTLICPQIPLLINLPILESTATMAPWRWIPICLELRDGEALLINKIVMGLRLVCLSLLQKRFVVMTRFF